MFKKAQDAADAEEPVDISEPLGLIRREVGRERTIWSAFPPLVLAGRARCVSSVAT